MIELWLFIALATLLILLAMLTFAWSVSSSNKVSDKPTENRRHEDNIRQYHQKIGELKASLLNGDIDQQIFDSLESEAQLQLLGDADDNVSSLREMPENIFHGIWLLWLAVALIPIVALIFYLPQGVGLGATDDISNRKLLDSIRASRDSTERSQLFEKLTLQLEKTLQRKHENDDARILLAKSYSSMERHREAVDVYHEHLKRYPESADAHAMLAESIYLANGAVMNKEVMQYVNQALRIDPKHPYALSLSGINDFTKGKYAAAISSWDTAIHLMPPGSAQRRLIEGGIQEARKRMQANSVDQASGNGPDQTEPVEGVRVNVRIAQQIDISNLPTSTTVFVFARAAQGRSMPLAAKRIAVGALPIEVKLTAEDQMAGTSLAGYEKIDVYARLSMSGQPTAKPGDWEGSVNNVPVAKDVNQASVVSLEINRQLSN